MQKQLSPLQKQKKLGKKQKTIHLFTKTFPLTEKPSLLKKKLIKETTTSLSKKKTKQKTNIFLQQKKFFDQKETNRKTFVENFVWNPSPFFCSVIMFLLEIPEKKPSFAKKLGKKDYEKKKKQSTGKKKTLLKKKLFEKILIFLEKKRRKKL